MATLSPVSDKRALTPPYFPAPQYAVLFRNWGIVPQARIAACLKAPIEELRAAAAAMGLDPSEDPDDRFLKRGFLGVIRANWHLLDYDGLCTLLDISKERLTFILKEDDFFWVKMGFFKPDTGTVLWHAPTESELADLKKIDRTLRANDLADLKENAFEFLAPFRKSVADPPEFVSDPRGDLRLIYSYFALYGDSLLHPELDPYPDALLEEYARLGVNGVWLQGILYQLVEHSLYPEISSDCEKRIAALRELCRRAKRFGISVYLYFNEPRSLPKAFFENHPELAGTNGDESYTTLCTSVKEVQEYLENASYTLFSKVPELGGYFTITRSENPTSCVSHDDIEPCPRCSARGADTIVAEINNLLYRGMRRASKTARAFAWTWGWKPAWAPRAIEKLDPGISVMNTSETAIETKIGGVRGEVIDYSISVVGPGALAKGLWDTAQKSGHACAAKVQFNNSWELSPVPFLPVFDLICRHARNLKQSGVRHLLLSWTLGGAPSVNLRFASRAMETDLPVEALIREYYSKDAKTVYQANQCFCRAFSEFPFDMNVLYFAPQQLGPAARFYAENTHYEASMTGFPYDDLKKWGGPYSENILERQFALLCEAWEEGLQKLDTIEFATPKTRELIVVARACYAHFASIYNHIRYLRARDHKQYAEIESAVKDEDAALKLLVECRKADSRIGFEAANHYFYTVRDLQEKALNLQYLRDYFAQKKEGSL